MRIKMLLMATATIFTFGCSSAKKNEIESAPIPPASPQDAAAASQSKPPATTSTDLEKSSTMCTAGQDTRMMEIEKSNPGCKLKYSKFSESDPVAWSFRGPDHCDKVRDQIRSTLEAAGFKCE